MRWRWSFGSDGEEEFEVQEIIDARIKKHKLEFLVKFRGFSEPEWEPASNLTHCDEALSEFYNKYPNTPSVEQARRIMEAIIRT